MFRRDTRAPCPPMTIQPPPKFQEPTPEQKEAKRQKEEEEEIRAAGPLSQNYLALDCLQLSVSWLDRSNLVSFVSVCKYFRKAVKNDTRDLYGCRQIMFGMPRSIQELLMKREAPPSPRNFQPFRMTEKLDLNEPTYAWEDSNLDSGSDWMQQQCPSSFERYEEELEEYNDAAHKYDHTFYSNGTYLRRDIYSDERRVVTGRVYGKTLTRGYPRRTSTTSTTGEIGIYHLGDFADTMGRDGKKKRIPDSVVLRTMACKIERELDEDGDIVVTRIARKSSDVARGERPDSIRHVKRRLYRAGLDLRPPHARSTVDTEMMRKVRAACEKAGEARTEKLTHKESDVTFAGLKECVPAESSQVTGDGHQGDEPDEDTDRLFEEEDEEEEEAKEEEEEEEEDDDDDGSWSFGRGRGRGRGGGRGGGWL